MSTKLKASLLQRSQQQCELCAAQESIDLYELSPIIGSEEDNTLVACTKCQAQLDKKEPLDAKHWQCLSTSMWSEVPAVQIASWRLLNRFKQESWATDLLDMMYLDDERLQWARASGDHDNDGDIEFHKDSNGNILQSGDSVVLIKSLDVKGSTLNAKMGTVVKNIRLVEENTEQIEGKIEGQVIVILTKYVRKQ